MKKIILGLMGPLFLSAYAFGGVTSSGGVAVNTHFLVCSFFSNSTQLPLNIVVTGEQTEPMSPVIGYRSGVAGWSEMAEFEGLKVVRNFYRVAPTDPTNQTFAFRYQMFPGADQKSIDILMYSTNVDKKTGAYQATMALKNVVSTTQDERFTGTCRIDVVYNQ